MEDNAHARKRQSSGRHIGGRVICERCGEEYTLMQSAQKFCTECRGWKRKQYHFAFSDCPDGYQQAILYLLLSYIGIPTVRCIDRHYIDAIAPLAPRSHPFLQRRAEKGKKDYWVLRSAALRKPALSEITDWRGFCRGFIELQGLVDTTKCRGSNRPRLRIWGTHEDLSAIMAALPAHEKTIQNVRTQAGATCALYYQSASEIVDILNYIDGGPKKQPIWNRWDAALTQGKGKKDEH